MNRILLANRPFDGTLELAPRSGFDLRTVINSAIDCLVKKRRLLGDGLLITCASVPDGEAADEDPTP